MTTTATASAPTTLTTEGIQNLLRDAEAFLNGAGNENARAKGLQLVSAANKALQAANRRDRQVSAGQDSSAAAKLLGERVDHFLRIQGQPESSWRNPSYVCA